MTKPLIFMQSLEQPELCFLGLPIRSVDPGYRLHISEEDLLSLELSPDRQPEIGAEVLCLALVSLSENHPPTANLLAPIVVNLKTRRPRKPSRWIPTTPISILWAAESRRRRAPDPPPRRPVHPHRPGHRNSGYRTGTEPGRAEGL